MSEDRSRHAARASFADELSGRMLRFDDPQAPARAQIALEAGRMGSWIWDIEAGTVVGDPFVAELLRLDPAAQPWPVDTVFAHMHPDDLPRVRKEVDLSLATDMPYEVEFRDTATDPATGKAGLRWLGARGRVTRRDADGNALEMVGVNWDATQQKTHEESLSMLAREMDHRVKNAFAVIRALINLGARTEGDKRAFADTLRAQVQAMADAHAISARLAREANAPDEAVPVAEVLRGALAPWLDERQGPPKARVDAPADLTISPGDVSALAMLVYELATNATKHGPLGNREGSLRVEVAPHGEAGWRMTWDETLGDAATRQAAGNGADEGEASGFGSVLIQHCIATLGARSKRRLDASGLKLELTVTRVE